MAALLRCRREGWNAGTHHTAWLKRGLLPPSALQPPPAATAVQRQPSPWLALSGVQARRGFDPSPAFSSAVRILLTCPSAMLPSCCLLPRADGEKRQTYDRLGEAGLKQQQQGGPGGGGGGGFHFQVCIADAQPPASPPAGPLRLLNAALGTGGWRRRDRREGVPAALVCSPGVVNACPTRAAHPPIPLGPLPSCFCSMTTPSTFSKTCLEAAWAAGSACTSSLEGAAWAEVRGGAWWVRCGGACCGVLWQRLLGVRPHSPRPDDLLLFSLSSLPSLPQAWGAAAASAASLRACTTMTLLCRCPGMQGAMLLLVGQRGGGTRARRGREARPTPRAPRQRTCSLR